MIEVALFVILLCASCTSGVSQRQFQFERGSKGVVDCPAMVDNGHSADDTESIYWSFSPKGSSESQRGIITYFHGVTTTLGSNHEQYDIQNTSLVIFNVTQSAEGTYSYSYSPWYEVSKEGSVEVSEKVSFKARRPKVHRCREDQPLCEIEEISDTTYIELTCSVEHTKPAVNISWFRWSSILDKWVEIIAAHHLEPSTCSVSETGCFYRSSTYNSRSTIKTSLESTKEIFKCVSNNIKLEDFIVIVTKNRRDFLNEVTDPTRLGSEEPTSTTISPSFECPSASVLLLTVLVGFVLLVPMVTLLIYYSYFKRKRRHTNKKDVRANHSQLEVEALK